MKLSAASLAVKACKQESLNFSPIQSSCIFRSTNRTSHILNRQNYITARERMLYKNVMINIVQRKSEFLKVGAALGATPTHDKLL